MLCTAACGVQHCPKHVELFMIINHNCCIKLLLLVIIIYDAGSHIHHINVILARCYSTETLNLIHSELLKFSMI